MNLTLVLIIVAGVLAGVELLRSEGRAFERLIRTAAR